MTKTVLALAALAAMGFSGAAFAEDAKAGSLTTGPAAMTDAQMDRVTAGQPSCNCIVTRSREVFPNWSDNKRAFRGFQGNSPNAAQCLGCNLTPSDLRLKRDIRQVAHLDNGLALYRYRYNWSDQVYVGVMAQEVALVRPDAVIRGADGYLRVDYSRLGLHLMTWEEWRASRLFKTAENGTTTAPKAMSDSEMDKVTAGAELWAFGYAVSAGNQTFVNTVPENANKGFNGNGWGSACLNFVGCGRN